MSNILKIQLPIVIIIVALVSFLVPTLSPIEQINENQIARKKQVILSIDTLLLALKNEQKNTKLKFQTNQAYFKVRNAYKKWEYLGEYLDPIFVKDYINGAPLPKLEKESFALNIIQPKGLQVIDEILFDTDRINQIPSLILLCENLKMDFEKSKFTKILDYHVFEAARTQLVRVFTLGLSGFDTPGSGAFIPDAMASLESIQLDIQYYDKATALSFEEAINYLKSQNRPDKFDHLYFLTTYINPLFKQLLKVHQKTGIELPHEINTEVKALNYLSENIFDQDFLNANFYTKIPPKYNNPQSKQLGQLLFFDPIFSENGKRACSSCHDPEKAYTDQKSKSTNFNNNGTLGRNSPSLLNSVFSERYFHDLRAMSFEDQMEHVIHHADEFNFSWNGVLKRINESPEYKQMFLNTYPEYEGKIQIQLIQFSISAYLQSLVALNSKFDQYVTGKTKNIDPSVKNGFNLFMGKAACGTCHFAPIFNGTVPPLYMESESENLGVPQNPYAKKQVLDSDLGRGDAQLKEKAPFYKHSFKTSSVRNVQESFPYMHNGAFKTLEDVMDFYNLGGGVGQKIEVNYQTLSEQALNLNKKEIKEIISFLNSLSDSSFVNQKPKKLPEFPLNSPWNNRKVGGEY